jgi:hypothetical protein
MKSKTNQLTLIYIITAVFLAIVLQTVPSIFLADYPFYTFSKDLIFVFFTGITWYILSANDNRNIFENSRKNNDEIKGQMKI